MQEETLGDWLSRFCVLHERAKHATLSADERTRYIKAREELAEAMLIAQQMDPDGDQIRRRNLRVAQALPVEVEMSGTRRSAITLDISAGGFSTMVSEIPAIGSRVSFKLKLGRGLGPVVGVAGVVNADARNGSVRMGLMFEEIAAVDRERIELVVVDAILKQFGR